MWLIWVILETLMFLIQVNIQHTYKYAEWGEKEQYEENVERKFTLQYTTYGMKSEWKKNTLSRYLSNVSCDNKSLN